MIICASRKVRKKKCPVSGSHGMRRLYMLFLNAMYMHILALKEGSGVQLKRLALYLHQK